jgi:hypothetical protein
MDKELRTNVRYMNCTQNLGKYWLVNLRIIFMWIIKKMCRICVLKVTIQIETGGTMVMINQPFTVLAT